MHFKKNNAHTQIYIYKYYTYYISYIQYIYHCWIDIEISISFLYPDLSYSVTFKNIRSRGNWTGESPEAGIEAALAAAAAEDAVPFIVLHIREKGTCQTVLYAGIL